MPVISAKCEHYHKAIKTSLLQKQEHNYLLSTCRVWSCSLMWSSAVEAFRVRNQHRRRYRTCRCWWRRPANTSVALWPLLLKHYILPENSHNTFINRSIPLQIHRDNKRQTLTEICLHYVINTYLIVSVINLSQLSSRLITDNVQSVHGQQLTSTLHTIATQSVSNNGSAVAQTATQHCTSQIVKDNVCQFSQPVLSSVSGHKPHTARN